MNRESYLTSAIEELKPLFMEQGVTIPCVKVSCSWPGGSSITKALGQCWPRESSKDGVNEIFISPLIGDPIRALDVLTHELVHAVDDCKHGHRKEFSQLASAIGLEGKPTSTHAGDELRARLETIVSMLGEYPHSGMTVPDRKKQTTRMIKLECNHCEAVWRMSSKWAEQVRLCPCCAELIDSAFKR